MTAVSVRGLVKRVRRQLVLDGVTMDVEAGQICGVLGPNGAGKSMLLRILAALEPPTAGTVAVGGYDAVEDVEQVRRQVGYVPDVFGLYESTTVWEYLDFFGRCWGIPSRDRRAIIADLLNLVDLYDRRSSEASTLSRGARQRLALGRALLHDPSLLLLDDPFAALDARGKVELIEVLRELADLGKTILIATNQTVEAQDACTAVAILVGGRLVFADETSALLNRFTDDRVVRLQVEGDAEPAKQVVAQHPGVDDLRLVTGAITFVYRGDRIGLADLLRSLTASGVAVSGVSSASPTLSELMISLQAGGAA